MTGATPWLGALLLRSRIANMQLTRRAVPKNYKQLKSSDLRGKKAPIIYFTLPCVFKQIHHVTVCLFSNINHIRCQNVIKMRKEQKIGERGVADITYHLLMLTPTVMSYRTDPPH